MGYAPAVGVGAGLGLAAGVGSGLEVGWAAAVGIALGDAGADCDGEALGLSLGEPLAVGGTVLDPVEAAGSFVGVARGPGVCDGAADGLSEGPGGSDGSVVGRAGDGAMVGTTPGVRLGFSGGTMSGPAWLGAAVPMMPDTDPDC